jgi:hypothetical protein
MTLNLALEGLRALLHEPPSAQGWERLRALIEAAPAGEARALALSYAADHLRRWPDHLRAAALEEDLAPWLDPARAPWAPLARSLRLSLITWDEPAMARFVAAPATAALRQLALHHNTLDEGALGRLCAAPWRAGLRAFQWYNAPPAQVAAFLRALPPDAALRALVIAGTALTHTAPDARRALMEALRRPALRHLSLQRLELEAADFQALAAAPRAPALEHLDLSGNRLDRAAIAPLLALAGPGLRGLLLGHNRLLHEGALALAAAPALMGLNVLDISYNGIAREESAAALARAPWWGGLRGLNLKGNRLELGAQRVLARRAPARLSWLDLSHAELVEEGLEALGGRPLSSLRWLGLSDSGLPLGALERLVRAPWWGGLRALALTGNPLGPGAGRLLARYGEGLRGLEIGGANLGAEGLRALLSRPGGLRLRSLSLVYSRTSARELAALLEGPGLPALQRLYVDDAFSEEEAAALRARAAARGVALILA